MGSCLEWSFGMRRLTREERTELVEKRSLEDLCDSVLNRFGLGIRRY